MTVHLMFWAVLVIIGSFFRGPGFNFILPWRRRTVLRTVSAAERRHHHEYRSSHRHRHRRRRRARGACRSSRWRAAATSAAPARSVRRDRAPRQVGAPHRPRRVESRSGAPPPRSRRPDRPAAATAPRSPRSTDDRHSSRGSPPDPEAIGVSRRQFFNRATVTLMSAGLGTFAASAFVAFLWPTGTGGFGGKVTVGKLDDIKAGISRAAASSTPPRPARGSPRTRPRRCPKAETVYPDNAARRHARRASSIAQYQKCPHLGCRVPQCDTSQWFECRCHGSQYNRVGEKKAGPAPRGMDHFPPTISRQPATSSSTPARSSRAADRHQHHRPRGRRPALHRRR